MKDKLLIILLAVGFIFAFTPGWLLAQTIYGDTSGNGSVTAFDAALVLRYTVKLTNLSPQQLIAADVTGDGTVSAYDASLILRRVVGLINRFPIEDKTADELIRQGKSSLLSGDIIGANNLFKQALELAPDSEEANFFSAVTRIFVVVADSQDIPSPSARIARGGRGLLDMLGIDSPWRELFNKNAATPAYKQSKITRFAQEPTPGQLQDYLVNYILPEVKIALASLEKVHRDFNVRLNIASLGGSSDVEIDYGDACLYKAALNLLEAVAEGGSVYNIDIDQGQLDYLASQGTLDIKRDIIEAYPNFLIIQDAQALLDAKAAVLAGIDDYLAASEFIRSETDPQGDDLVSLVRFSQEEANQDDLLTQEKKFRALLLDIKNSLNSQPAYPFKASLSQFVNLGWLFDHPVSPRILLNSQGMQAVLRDNALPLIGYALNNMDNAPVNFSQVLTPQDDLVPSNMNIDYGDIALLKSTLKFAKTVLHLICSYDINVDTYDTLAKATTGDLDVGNDIIVAHPNLWNLIDSSQLTQAKLSFEGCIDDYLIASEIIRDQGGYDKNDNPLNIAYDADHIGIFLIKEASFRRVLNDVKLSLHGLNSVTYIYPDGSPDSFRLDLTRLFDAQPHLRGLAPRFSFNPLNKVNSIVPGSFPDPTFNGALPEWTQEDLR